MFLLFFLFLDGKKWCSLDRFFLRLIEFHVKLVAYVNNYIDFCARGIKKTDYA